MHQGTTKFLAATTVCERLCTDSNDDFDVAHSWTSPNSGLNSNKSVYQQCDIPAGASVNDCVYEKCFQVKQNKNSNNNNKINEKTKITKR